MKKVLPTLALSILPEFLRWHFIFYPKRIVRDYAGYAAALASIFSFAYLLHTLISPWKAIADVYPKKGLNLTEIGSVFALNMTARGVGLVIRLGTIFIGLIVQAACLAFFAVYLAAWVLYPLLLVASIFLFTASFLA